MAKVIFNDRYIAKLLPHDTNARSKSKEIACPTAPYLKIVVGKAVGGKLPAKTWGVRYIWAGKKSYMSLGRFPEIKLEEAITFARDIIAKVDKGIDPRAEVAERLAMPLMEDFLMNSYLKHAKETKKSWVNDESKIRIHLIPRFGKRLLNSLTRRDVEQFIAEIGRSHSAAMANRMLSLISVVYRKAEHWELVSFNPAKGISKIPEENEKTGYLTPEQAKLMIIELENDDNFVANQAIQFLLYTGVRRNEALTLTWDAVNMKDRTFYLRYTKAKRSRHVVLSDIAFNVLNNMKNYSNSNYVFPGKDPSKPYVNINKPLARALKAAGLDWICPHTLRHTFASWLVAGGTPLYVTQKLLGHSSPLVTQRYAHLADDELRDSAQMIGRLMG